MKKVFCLTGLCFLVLASHEQAFGQVMIPSCPKGYHVEILKSDKLSALQKQTMDLDSTVDTLRKKQQSDKADTDSLVTQQAVDQADKEKSATVSTMLIEQGRNMRCVPN